MVGSGEVEALGPSAWLAEKAYRLPSEGVALDLACGRGHNALYLATRGLRVRAVDRDESLVDSLRERAEHLGLPLSAEVWDLENGPFPFEVGGYALINVFRYLHRPLFPVIEAALAPG
jgi:SAM-dependent methyltransferase